MKKIVNILIVLIGSLSVYAQHPLAKSSFGDWKATDNTGYILNADQDAVRWKDTVYYNASKLRNCRYASIPVTLTNITADTLKYIDMSCSKLDIFTTDVKAARIFQDLKDCFKNGPDLFKLAPYGSITFNVPIYFFSNEVSPDKILIQKEFKIGMGLLKYTGKTAISQDFQDIGFMMNNRKNLIWSDTIIVQ